MSQLEACLGCGGMFSQMDGPTHRYMLSSPGCWQAYGAVLAREYSNPKLMPTHRLSVDAYAVQHPGNRSRQSIQSVGFHLARLMLQLESALAPQAANDLMVRLASHKASLPLLSPPSSYELTVADVVPATAPEDHANSVRAWAQSAWDAWSDHHAFVREWAATHT